MAYTSWIRVENTSINRLPDFEETVMLTLEDDATKDRIVTAGFLKNIDKSGPHWIFGIADSLDPKKFTVIAWGEAPSPYTITRD